MILPDDEIKERIESPLNLLNRLKTSLNRTSGGLPSTPIPGIPPTSDEIIDNLEDKIAHNGTRSKAAKILNSAMDELGKRIPEVQKPEKLAQIAREMSQVISNHDAKGTGGEKLSQIIVYAPQIQSLDNFEIIDVNE
jgi:hypothetical protein